MFDQTFRPQRRPGISLPRSFPYVLMAGLCACQVTQAGPLPEDLHHPHYSKHGGSHGQMRPVGVADSVTPGYGYYTLTHMPLSRNCLANSATPDNVVYSQPSALLTFAKTVSQEDLSQTLNVDISGGGGFGLFSASAAAHYMRSVQETRYSSTFNYLGVYSATGSFTLPEAYGIDALNSFGQSAYNAGAQAFFNACGNGFIAATSAGTALAVSLGVTFHSSTELDTFNANAHTDWGFNGLAGQVASVFSQHNLQGSIALQAIQLGGVPTHLAQIFTKDPEKGYYILNCDLTHIADCDAAISGVIDYAQGDFQDQIQFQNGQPVDPLLLYNFYGEPMKYDEALGISFIPQPITPEVRQQQWDLTEWYRNDTNTGLFLDSFIQSVVSPYFTVETKQFFESALPALDARLAEYDYNDVITNCYGPLANDECDVAYQNIAIARDHFFVNQTIVNHLLYDSFILKWEGAWERHGFYT